MWNPNDRLERLSIRSKHSQAKIAGTLVTIGGAMLMTLVKGPVLDLPWTNSASTHVDSTGVVQKPIQGAIMITAGCFCWASFIILQVSSRHLSLLNTREIKHFVLNKKAKMLTGDHAEIIPSRAHIDSYDMYSGDVPRSGFRFCDGKKQLGCLVSQF